MKPILKKVLAFVVAIIMNVNMKMDTIKQYVNKLKDKQSRRNLIVKIGIIGIVFGMTKLFGIANKYYTGMEMFALALGLHPFVLIGAMLIFRIKPAESLNQEDNESTYDAISLVWSYPIAMLFSAISCALTGIVPSLIITGVVFGIKYIINSEIKSELIDANELYLHTKKLK